MHQVRSSAAAAHPAVEDAETARRALRRVEQAAGSDALDADAVHRLIAELEAGSHALAGALRRLANGPQFDDAPPATPQLRDASELARSLAAALRAFDGNAL